MLLSQQVHHLVLHRAASEWIWGHIHTSSFHLSLTFLVHNFYHTVFVLDATVFGEIFDKILCSFGTWLVSSHTLLFWARAKTKPNPFAPAERGSHGKLWRGSGQCIPFFLQSSRIGVGLNYGSSSLTPVSGLFSSAELCRGPSLILHHPKMVWWRHCYPTTFS